MGGEGVPGGVVWGVVTQRCLVPLSAAGLREAVPESAAAACPGRGPGGVPRPSQPPPCRPLPLSPQGEEGGGIEWAWHLAVQ